VQSESNHGRKEGGGNVKKYRNLSNRVNKHLPTNQRNTDNAEKHQPN
jgi:hypothetical protein